MEAHRSHKPRIVRFESGARHQERRTMSETYELALLGALTLTVAFGVCPELSRIGTALWDIQKELKADREMRAAQYRESIRRL